MAEFGAEMEVGSLSASRVACRASCVVCLAS